MPDFPSIEKTNVNFPPQKANFPRRLPIPDTRSALCQFVDTVTLGSVLGEGAMGRVYEATHDDTGQRVVVKELLFEPELEMQGTKLLHALRGKLNNVADVLAIDHTPGQEKVLIERAKGENLGDLLEKNPSGLPRETAVRIVEGVARALHSFEEHGLVHRDIKTWNIMVDVQPNGTVNVKVIDAGLVVTMKESSTPKMIGTFAFASPEQLAGDRLTAKSDVYALGKVLRRLLVGRADTLDSAPADLRMLVERMTSVDPAARPSPKEMLDVNNLLQKQVRLPVVQPPPLPPPPLPKAPPEVSARPITAEHTEPTFVEKPKPIALTKPTIKTSPKKSPARVVAGKVGTTVAGFGLAMAAGYATSSALDAAGVKNKVVHTLAPVAVGHGVGVGITYASTGKMPGAKIQVTGLVNGLGGSILATEAVDSALNSAGVSSTSMLRSPAAKFVVGTVGGIAAGAAGTVALPFTAAAIVDKGVGHLVSDETYSARLSDLDVARRQMMETAENGENGIIARGAAYGALGLTFIPIFKNAVTVFGSDAK